MKDERYWPVLGTWLKDTAVTPPDARQTAREVGARLPQTPQLRRRWWLPSLRRTPTTPFDDDQMADRQVVVLPMTDRFPAITGRTRTMFSPVKAITVGALVFAIGGAFLITQPFDQQGTMPGAEQGAEPPAPVRVTSEHNGIRCDTEPVPEVDGAVERATGFTCEVLNDWSDPRLEGTDVYVDNSTSYDLADGGELNIYHKVHDIVTDDGVWRMRPYLAFDGYPGAPDISDYPQWWVLDGEDAYEGFSLLLVLGPNSETLDGYIVSSDLLPPAPERMPTD